ncbi:MAG: BRO family protein [Bacteroidales bacterium]
MQRHWKGIAKRDTVTPSRGVQELLYIPEPDVYRLIMRSKLTDAKSYYDWVFEDMLPTIRKTVAIYKPQRRTLQEQSSTGKQEGAGLCQKYSIIANLFISFI